jgi:hypothetical protein
MRYFPIPIDSDGIPIDIHPIERDTYLSVCRPIDGYVSIIYGMIDRWAKNYIPAMGFEHKVFTQRVEPMALRLKVARSDQLNYAGLDRKDMGWNGVLSCAVASIQHQVWDISDPRMRNPFP